MPVFEQGYRPYTGPVRRGSRALAIAWESFRPRVRWWIWLLLLAFLFWPYIVHAVMAYLVLMLKVVPLEQIALPDAPIYEHHGPLDPRRFFSAVASNSGKLFWEVLNDAFAGTGPVVLSTVACAGILAADRRTGALQLYLARPVTRIDYLAGKLLAVAGFCALLTLVPTLLLWIECAALQSSFAFIAGTWYVPFSVLAASAAYTLWTAGLVLLASSLLHRPVLIATVVVFGYLFLLGLGGVLAGSTDDKRWLAMVPHYALGALTAPLFGLRVPDWLPWHLTLPMAVGFPVLCFAIVVRRIRGVEVVT